MRRVCACVAFGVPAGIVLFFAAACVVFLTHDTVAPL
jgi:Na+/serine symporter